MFKNPVRILVFDVYQTCSVTFKLEIKNHFNKFYLKYLRDVFFFFCWRLTLLLLVDYPVASVIHYKSDWD